MPGYELVAGDDAYNSPMVGDEIGDEVGDEIGDEVGADLRDLIAGNEMIGDEVGAWGRGRAMQRRGHPQHQGANVLRGFDTRLTRIERSIATIGRAVAQGAKIRLQGGTTYQETLPTKSRNLFFSFDSGATLVPAGAQVQIGVSPQVIFKGLRLVVPATLGDSFTLDDIRVGKDSQFVAAGSAPASAFSATAVGVGIDLDVCRVGQQIVILVTNQTAGALRFRATLFGKALTG